MQPSSADLRALARRDPFLGRAMKRVDPFPGFPGAAQRLQRTHFHALARAIVHQQLAGAAARTIHDRVVALTPGRNFPRPEQVLALSDSALRGAGLSRAKLAALRDLAARVHSRELVLAGLGRCDDEEVIEQLTRVRGIGVWSAQMFLIFRLGRLDGLAERPTPKSVLSRGECWRPLSSVASWVLWRLADSRRAATAPRGPSARRRHP
jgi:DNA-3-methyladenine glycosylase II